MDAETPFQPATGLSTEIVDIVKGVVGLVRLEIIPFADGNAMCSQAVIRSGATRGLSFKGQDELISQAESLFASTLFQASAAAFMHPAQDGQRGDIVGRTAFMQATNNRNSATWVNEDTLVITTDVRLNDSNLSIHIKYLGNSIIMSDGGELATHLKHRLPSLSVDDARIALETCAERQTLGADEKGNILAIYELNNLDYGQFTLEIRESIGDFLKAVKNTYSDIEIYQYKLNARLGSIVPSPK